MEENGLLYDDTAWFMTTIVQINTRVTVQELVGVTMLAYSSSLLSSPSSMYQADLMRSERDVWEVTLLLKSSLAWPVSSCNESVLRLRDEDDSCCSFLRRKFLAETRKLLDEARRTKSD